MSLLDASQWDDFLARPSSQAHILQSTAWGELKSAFGWSVARLQAGECGAQVLFRRLPFGFSFAYIPRGPVGADWSALWPELDQLCWARRAIFLKVEPDQASPLEAHQRIHLAGFQPGPPVQPPRTVLVSLEGSEQDWLGRMKPKTRYNIRLAERKGILVRPSTDLGTFQKLMEITARRDGFGVHSQAYYQRAFDLFSANDHCTLLQAEFEGRPLAALMVFAFGKRAWYFYGASSDEERSRMPTYLLQWQAMRWAASRGCIAYDLWGIPDLGEEILEDEFADRQGGLWGVYRFKRGFGGEVWRAAGAWDKVYQPLFYRLYLAWVRRRGGEAA